MEMMETVLGYLVGLVVGIVLGMLGGGGSLLAVAILYLLGKDENRGTAYITVLVGVTSLFGTLPRIRQRLIDWPTVLALGIPVTAGMLLVRLWLFDQVPDYFTLGTLVISKRMFVLLIVAALMLLSAATMLGLIGRNIKSRADLRARDPILYYFSLILCGLAIGIFPGFSGAGGGVLIVPLLVIFFGLEMKTVVGTSLAIITMKSFVGFFCGDLFRLKGVTIEYGFLVGFAVVMVSGVIIGTTISQKINAERLKTIFGWFLFGLAIFIFVYELYNAKNTSSLPVVPQ
jgi:uncharacterized membrane protein YfcA